jgi:hypothetical protein
MANKPFNAFKLAQDQFDSVAEQLGLDQATKDLLRNTTENIILIFL